MLNEISEYCINLSDQDKRIRQYSFDKLIQLGADIVQFLEKIIITQDSIKEKNWFLLIGAVSTLNQLKTQSTSKIVRRYQNDLNWLPEEKGRSDLHVHTNLSDGTLSVEKLIKEAVRSCVKILSICDHNTMDGINLAQSIGARHGIRIIPACELTTHYNISDDENPDWIEIHITAYFLDPNSSIVNELMMNTQRRIQLRDILIANEFLHDNADRFVELYGKIKDILDVIIAANKHYCKILNKNKLNEKAQNIDTIIKEIESNKNNIKIALFELINNATKSSTFYEYSDKEEALLKKLILFSGYMIDHAMNSYYNKLTRQEFKGGNWFSEIKKRQDKYVHCLPKISPNIIIQKIYDLGGVPVLSHPTWYPVLWLQKSKRKIKETYQREITKLEENELHRIAISKGIKIVRKFHEIMPNGLQILELYHWSYDTELDLEQPFKKLADELGASITASSDFHGPQKYGEHRSKIGTGVNYNILGTYSQVKALERLK